MCNDCAICIDTLFPKNASILRLKNKVLVKRGERLPITKLKCGHMFHNKCIKNWFKKTEVESSIKCPLCRDNIRFKPDSKDLMMNKIRHNNPNYEYGDKSGYGRHRYVFRFPGLDGIVSNEIEISYEERVFTIGLETIDWSSFSFDDEGNIDWRNEPENQDRELVYYDDIL